MKKVKEILNKIEVIFYFICAAFTVPLHSSIPYNIWLFLFDFSIVLLMVLGCFLPGEVGDEFDTKYELFCMRVWGILGIIILAKYTDFFEALYSRVFE